MFVSSLEEQISGLKDQLGSEMRNRQLLIKGSASSVVPGEEALKSVLDATPVADLLDASKLVSHDDLSYTPHRGLPGGRLGARSPVRSGAGRFGSPVRGSTLRK